MDLVHHSGTGHRLVDEWRRTWLGESAGAGAWSSWLAADDLAYAAAGDHTLVKGAERESTFMLLRDHWIRQVAQVDKRRLGRISADEERISATCSSISANVGVHKRHV